MQEIRAYFKETYAALRDQRGGLMREGEPAIREETVQAIWYDQLFRQDALKATDGRTVRVVGPGWWNRQDGPDFKNAQVEFNGRLVSGDVEIHLSPQAWEQHGHHLDDHYDQVILHVTLHAPPSPKPAMTSQGKTIPLLVLDEYLEDEILRIQDRLEGDGAALPEPFGRCADFSQGGRSEQVVELLGLAGDWRMVFKARALRERMDRVGPDQALYEGILSACGYSRFKHHFGAVARSLPYDRVRQLALQDPMVLEAAMLRIAGLLPENLPEDAASVPHFARLCDLKRNHIGGLKPLPLTWPRTGVRPNNYPERRLAGAVRFFARTASDGLAESVYRVWLEEASPLKRRRRFEALFPGAMGFWATHCAWTGKKLIKPTAPLGPGRIRSIIGNVIIPAGLAMARQSRNRTLEGTVMDFFAALPKETENHILKRMEPRIFGNTLPPRMTFRLQQGLLQMYHDWCDLNPSCQNCRVARCLEQGEKLLP